MAGAVSGIPRLTLITVVIAIVLTVCFHWLYPDVAITTGLQLEFVLVAFLGALAAEGLLHIVARRRTPRQSGDAAPAHDESGEGP